MKILVVDDDPFIRQLVSAVLRPLGHTIVEADSFSSAVQLLVIGDIDMVITDNDMINRQNEGLEILAYVETILSRPPVVIWMSGRLSGDPGLGDEAYKLGARAILSKPFTLEELRGLISKIETEMITEVSPA